MTPGPPEPDRDRTLERTPPRTPRGETGRSPVSSAEHESRSDSAATMPRSHGRNVGRGSLRSPSAPQLGGAEPACALGGGPDANGTRTTRNRIGRPGHE